MTVWAVHPIKYDVSAAMKFGELRYVNKHYVYGDELDTDQDPAIKRNPAGEATPAWTLPRDVYLRLEKAAHEFSPGKDFLLIVGDHLQLLQFIGLLMTCQSYADVLRYDRKIQDYLPVRLRSTLPVPPTFYSRIGNDTNAQDRYCGR